MTESIVRKIIGYRTFSSLLGRNAPKVFRRLMRKQPKLSIVLS